MIKSHIAVVLAALFATSALAWDNDCPVSGRRPTFTIGTNKIGIDLELTYDLLCPDCAEHHPILMQWLNMTWNVTNTRVIDEISVAFSFMPLPWHNGGWVPYMLIPFFWDNCQYGPNPCQFMDYVQFTFDNQEWIYSAKNMTEN